MILFRPQLVILSHHMIQIVDLAVDPHLDDDSLAYDEVDEVDEEAGKIF